MMSNQKTRYPKRAHLLLCSSSVSCNNPAKGRAPFDPDALKKRWRETGASKTCFLQITGCLGMCDLGNSGCLITPNETYWLGGLTPEHHEALIAWLQAGAVLERLPEVILERRIQRLEEAK